MIRLSLAVIALFALSLQTLPAQESNNGRKAPDFELQDSTGKTHRLSDHADGLLVLEWTNRNCPFVVRHYNGRMQKLAAAMKKRGVTWLAVDSTKKRTAEAVESWRKQKSIEHSVLLDPTGMTGRAYGAQTTPHLFVIDHGTIVYEGAIDDGRNGKAKVNYVLQAVEEIQAQKPVSMPKTKPYGCSVKYAKRPKGWAASQGVWFEDLDKAMAVAKKARRPLLVNFTGSDWCGWCIKLDNEVFSKPEFKTWAKSEVVLVKLDFPRRKPQDEEVKKKNRALATKYGVRGFPTILFLDPQAEVIGKSGYLPGGPTAWVADARSKLGKN